MVALSSKKCFKCGEVKILSAFYKHSQMSDGHINKCKECTKIDVRGNASLRKDYYNAYDRVRSKTPERKDQRRKNESKPERKEKISEYKRNYRYSAKQKAANTVIGNAVRDGRLLKLPCWICGCEDVEGHHPDYDAPLEVIWLCTAHHAEIHRDFSEDADKVTLETTEKGSRWK